MIVSAKVVFIFWGPNFNNAASTDYSYARTLQAFRNQFGTTGEYNTITQYSGILLSNLGSRHRRLVRHHDAADQRHRLHGPRRGQPYYSGGHGAFNSSTVYEVFIPTHLVLLERLEHLVRRPEPRLLRLPRHYTATAGNRQVLDRALSELQRLQGLRLDGRAERRSTSSATRPARP